MPRRPSRIAAIAFLLTVVAAMPARARQSAAAPAQQAPSAPAPLPSTRDIVALTYGDRLRGEIKALSKGRLSFDVKAAGVISIKWDYVTELTSDSVFLVETNEGAQVLGTLPKAEPGKLSVATASARWDFEIASVVSIVPIRRSFFERLDGSINLGGGYTQASGIAQLSFTFNVKARRPAFEWRILAEDYVTFESDGATSQRLKSSVGYSRDVTGLWAVFAAGQLERNPDLGFDFRGTLGGGLERTLLRSNRSFLTVGAGLAVSREVPVDASSETLLPALLTLRHAFYTYDTPKTSLETTFTALPILNQSGRWRLEANTSVSRELFKDFSVAVTFYESYDNRPPSVEANKNDAGVSLSIAFTF